MTNTANLGMPFIEGSQAQKHVTHNEALRILDAAVQIGVLTTTLTTPPSTPSAGDRHVVATGATGAWAGQAKNIATWEDGAWRFVTPKAGWFLWSAGDDGLFVYNGTAWRNLHDLTTALDNAGHIGINTTASSPNLLTVRSNAALFNAIAVAGGGTGDARVQISKESSAKTASVVFSDAFSGRAEFGLIGSDAFKLKVSNDGSTFVEALCVDQSSGSTTLPRGLLLTGVIAPSQITSNQNDYNPTGLGNASVLNLSSDVSRSVSGLSGGAEGRVIALVNVGNQNITLVDESASSSAANRFTLGGDVSLGAKQGIVLRYDNTATRWYALARSGASGALLAANNLSDLASKPTARVNLGVRDVLTANRTYYVRTDGNDSNNGLANTSGGAFLTLQRAWNVIVSTLDLAGFTVTVQIADGTYTGGVDMLIPAIGGGVIFNGNSGATSNVMISTTSDDCFYLNAACQVEIRYMKLQAATSGNCLLARYPGAKMFLTNVNFGSCAGVHISSQYGAVIECASSYTVSGGANVHVQAYLGGTLDFYSHTATMSGTPAWGTAFAQCSMTGKASLYSVTYSGSAAGKRYVADTNSILQTYGAGTASTYFPGNVNGTTATGGVQA